MITAMQDAKPTGNIDKDFLELISIRTGDHHEKTTGCTNEYIPFHLGSMRK